MYSIAHDLHTSARDMRGDDLITIIYASRREIMASLYAASAAAARGFLANRHSVIKTLLAARFFSFLLCPRLLLQLKNLPKKDVIWVWPRFMYLEVTSVTTTVTADERDWRIWRWYVDRRARGKKKCRYRELLLVFSIFRDKTRYEVGKRCRGRIRRDGRIFSRVGKRSTVKV